MFGYVRPYKPYMRIFEYDIYKAVYCGLCKDMGRRNGFFTRFTLSYDFTFLALMELSVKDKKLEACRQRCIAHPLKKTMCACATDDISYSSVSAVILTYHKLRDDIADKGIKGKITAMLTLPFFRKPYKKAKAEYPVLAEKIESAMALQKKVEEKKTDGIDIACEPTAQMMSAVFSELSDDADTKMKLERFGYLLGRYIYITDALDDLKDDHKKGSYNPLLNTCNVKTGGDKIPDEQIEAINNYADDSINFTLGSLADTYVELGTKRYKDILDNIIYLGLKNVYASVRNGTFRNKTKKGNKTNELQ